MCTEPSANARNGAAGLVLLNPTTMFDWFSRKKAQEVVESEVDWSDGKVKYSERCAGTCACSQEATLLSKALPGIHTTTTDA